MSCALITQTHCDFREEQARTNTSVITLPRANFIAKSVESHQACLMRNTNLIHQHDYDGQLGQHLERQGPPWDDGVLKAGKDMNIMRMDRTSKYKSIM